MDIALTVVVILLSDTNLGSTVDQGEGRWEKKQWRKLAKRSILNAAGLKAGTWCYCLSSEHFRPKGWLV